MKKFLPWIIVVIVILIVIFRKQIGKFFGMNGTLAEGSACTTVLGKPGKIINGACSEISAPIDIEAPATRIIQDFIRVPRYGRNPCVSRIIHQGYVYVYSSTSGYYCIYKRAI